MARAHQVLILPRALWRGCKWLLLTHVCEVDCYRIVVSWKGRIAFPNVCVAGTSAFRMESATENNYPHLLKTAHLRKLAADIRGWELAVPGSRPPDTAKASTPKRTTTPQAPAGAPEVIAVPVGATLGARRHPPPPQRSCSSRTAQRPLDQAVVPAVSWQVYLALF